MLHERHDDIRSMVPDPSCLRAGFGSSFVCPGARAAAEVGRPDGELTCRKLDAAFYKLPLAECPKRTCGLF